MIAFWLKAVLSGLIVAAATTVARRHPALGALIVSLPLVSVLSMVVLRVEGASDRQLADYVATTMWFFLPSIPMFLLIPALIRHGLGFWPALVIGCAVTMVLYLAAQALGARLGLFE